MGESLMERYVKGALIFAIAFIISSFIHVEIVNIVFRTTISWICTKWST